MNNDSKNTSRFASPPCFAHELGYGPDDNSTSKSNEAANVVRWRTAERKRQIALRLSVPAIERQRFANIVAEHLDRLILPASEATVSLYWPFNGELNLRPWMLRLYESGVCIALPIVEAKAQPLSFREWTPHARMEPGIWNIPIPVDGNIVTPTVVIAPVVGFDENGYRLGYGGGFFDRTLASMIARQERPQIIGVGHSSARLGTIYPQPHDIAMDVIVTESGIYKPPGV